MPSADHVYSHVSEIRGAFPPSVRLDDAIGYSSTAGQVRSTTSEAVEVVGLWVRHSNSRQDVVEVGPESVRSRSDNMLIVLEKIKNVREYLRAHRGGDDKHHPLETSPATFNPKLHTSTLQFFQPRTYP